MGNIIVENQKLNDEYEPAQTQRLLSCDFTVKKDMSELHDVPFVFFIAFIRFFCVSQNQNKQIECFQLPK